MNLLERIMAQMNPAPNPALKKASEQWQTQLPTLWLLGKTGAGKSSLIQAITGHTHVAIGNGFRPCTPHSFHYNFPVHKPVLRFLDTRGLAEADYQADDDIRQCQSQSHALIVVMKAEDTEQSCVLEALKQIRQSGGIKQVLLVHTGIFLLPNETERARCIRHNQEQVTSIWKGDYLSVSVDFEKEDGSQWGLDALKRALCTLLPMLNHILLEAQQASQEEHNFAQLKTEILWYAGTASASDAVPGVGLVSVPTIQAKMLHSLANQYGVNWDKRLLAEFIGTLGTGFGVQYVSRLGIRQLVKLIPVYGQTLGAASAAAMSFCSTYAMGRVACKYLYHKNKGEAVSEEEMNALYRNAFHQIKAVTSRETHSE